MELPGARADLLSKVMLQNGRQFFVLEERSENKLSMLKRPPT